MNSNVAKIKIINEDLDEESRKSHEILNAQNSQFSSNRTVKSNNLLDPQSCVNSNDYLNNSKTTSLSNFAGNLLFYSKCKIDLKKIFYRKFNEKRNDYKFNL